MMRLARRASLLVVFLLLTSAATAYAECAWVQWWTGANVAYEWSVLDAHPTLSECDRALERDMRSLKRDGYEVHGAPGSGGHGFSAEKGSLRKTYQCSPTPSTRAGRRGSNRHQRAGRHRAPRELQRTLNTALREAADGEMPLLPERTGRRSARVP